MTAELPFHARFGGVDWSADLPLAQFDAMPGGAPGAITVTRQERTTDLGELRMVGRARIGTSGVRFNWDDEVSFELTAGNRIGWIAGPNWHGSLPQSFFSSMAAIALAWRGLVPMHASAVVLHDRAWLIAGNAGAGKSSLTAELLGAGAQFLADDLTVLSPGPIPMAWLGRPAVRLHPATAAGIAQVGAPVPLRDGRGKVLVRPVSRAADRAWPVGGMLALNNRDARALSPGETAAALASALFRPRIISALPARSALRARLLDLAAAIPVVNVPLVRGFEAPERSARIAAVFAAIERLDGLKPRLQSA